MVVEDVLALAGLIVRTILPANFEEFLRKQPPGVVWAIVVAKHVSAKLGSGKLPVGWRRDRQLPERQPADPEPGIALLHAQRVAAQAAIGARTHLT
jgi:hypothetical protein